MTHKSNALYDSARQAFGNALLNWTADSVKVIMVHIGGALGHIYKVNLKKDTFLSDIPVGSRVAVSSELLNKTNTKGVMGADDAFFSIVHNSNPVGALVLYQDTSVETTSRLIAYLSAMQGLPYVPHAANVVVEWPRTLIDGVMLPRIFKL